MSLPSVAEITLTNDTAGSTTMGFTWDAGVIGNLTATQTNLSLMVPKYAGAVTGVILMDQNGVDVSNPLSVALAVNKNGTDICSTDAAIAKSAGAGSQATFVAATGVTPAVIKNDGTQQFVAGDFFSYTLTVTRTASPGTEMSQPRVIVTGIRYTT